MDAGVAQGSRTKSWKKTHVERNALKKQRKQERFLKSLDKGAIDEELTPPKPNKQIPSTVSIAVPGSILENAQSSELCSYLAGQIARAACVFRVNEVIVFDDVGMETARETKKFYGDADNEQQNVRGSSLKLARILQYLECPQYLRKFFFPMHKDLKYAGLLNPLDAPHHLRQQNMFLYREGVVADKKAKEGYCYVNVGLLNDVLVKKAIEPGMRVTVKLENVQEGARKLHGTVVSPNEPRLETGVYWGYSVRIAHSLSEIFSHCPYDSYDLTIGTSDRGDSIQKVPSQSYSYNHALIVFGGLQGLEEALSNDSKLDVDDPGLLFDHYLNVLPKQGSRTIRTEEALLITMAALQDKLKPQIEEVDVALQDFLPSSADTGMPQQHVAAFHKRQLMAKDSDSDKFIKKKRTIKSSDSLCEEGTTNAIRTKNTENTAISGKSENIVQMDTSQIETIPTIDEDLSRFD